MVDDGTAETTSRGDITNLGGAAGSVPDRGGWKRGCVRGHRETSLHENHDN